MKLPSIVTLLASAFLTVGAPSVALIATHSSAQARGTCGADYYSNVDGRCVHRPMKARLAPTGATAKCRDGTYSFSQHHSGTCSYHGGVAEWL